MKKTIPTLFFIGLALLVLALLNACAHVPGEGDELTVNQALYDVSSTWKYGRDGVSGDFVVAVIKRVNQYDPDIPVTMKVVTLDGENHGVLELYTDPGQLWADHRYPVLMDRREFWETLR